MKHIRSIYSDDPGIRVHGLRIRRVRLNRHLPEARWVANHQHPFSQILLYLGGGSGWQTIAGQNHASARGRLFFLPPGVPHAFLEPAGQKPLCLALDLDLDQAPAAPVIRQLTSMDLSLVRHALSGLTRWRTGHERIEPGEAAEVLRLCDIFFRALGILRGRPAGPGQSAVFRTVQRALHTEDALRWPLAEIARKTGYHPDYLNRTLKGICGLTLGELRDEVRLQKSKHLLAGGVPIADAAEGAGFGDPNYFSRWFRAQTGRTPSAWRAGNTETARR